MKKRSIMRIFFFVVLLGVTSGAVFSGEQGNPADLKELLVARNFNPRDIRRVRANFRTVGPVEVTYFNVDEPGLPFRKAMRVRTLAATELPWEAQVRWDVLQSVRKGDLIFARLWLRSSLQGDIQRAPITNLLIKRKEDTGQALQKGRHRPVTGEWHPYYYYAVMPAASRDWYLEFHIGYFEQEFEVGGVEIVNLGNAAREGFDLSLLPVTETENALTYPGQEPEAPWRQVAKERIQELRMAKLVVEVVDGEGKPLPGAEVKVEMERHAFPFGTAVTAQRLTGNQPDDEKYRQVVKERFNRVVFENDLKTPPWSGQWGKNYSREKVLKALDWLDEQGIPARGHTLFWATHKHMLTGAGMTVREIKNNVEARIRDRLTALAGRLVEWDVHNHPVMFTEITDDIGWEATLDFWRLARETDSRTRLAINEGSILPFPHRLKEKYKERISWLLARGAPVEAIGFMSHFSSATVTPPERIWEILDEFAGFGLPLVITEFDMAINDRHPEEVQLQVDFTRDFLIAVFSHPAVDSFLSWGFWAGQHWKPEAAFYDKEWNLRPHGQAYMDLVFGEWWTEEVLTTDEDGRAEVYGFKGEYKITAAANGWTAGTEMQLGDGGTTVRLEIK
jgi:GH35 family endo-1,4-beta-xylanase